jgi:3-phenylpropionate/trans-cinnamate dioxygenase alpha subunit
MDPLAGIIDKSRRTVSPNAFTDPTLYQLEQERVFGRCWLFLGHESQLPTPGSFISTYMGEEPIIVWRGSDGTIRAFINSCRHRGMRICREDEGKASRFTCPYHGWTYNSSGALIGRPNKDRYDDNFKPQEWGLIEVARVENFAGLIFGNFDRDAESLDDYLGEVKYYLESQFRRTKMGRVILPGVQKWTLDINWKVVAETFGGDNYHVPIVHRSGAQLGLLGDPSQFARAAPFEQDFQVCTTGGHGWINLTPSISPFAPAAQFEAYEATVREEARTRLTPKQADLSVTSAVGGVFPTFAFVSFQGGVGIRVFHPRGPGKTELWNWCAADADAPEWHKALSREINIRCYSAGGLIDIDDSEMWYGCQSGMGGFQRSKYPLNYQLGESRGRREDERPGLIDSTPSEAGVFSFHERWYELMNKSNS